MTGINVLSTGASVRGKEDGFSVLEKTQAGSESAIMEFAAILNGWVAQLGGQGQGSGFQSNEPAGKEANSGRNALLGLEGLQALMGTIPGYGNPLEVPTNEVQGKQVQTLRGWTNGRLSEAPVGANTLESLLAQLGNLRSAVATSNPVGTMGEADRSGMMQEQPQGKNSPLSELDLYKGIISELLKDMSGEIKDKSPINPENLNTSAQNKSLLASQRMNSGLFTAFVDEKLSQSQSQQLQKSQSASESVMNTIPSDTSSQGDNILPGNGLSQDVNVGKPKVDSDFKTFSQSLIPSSQGELAGIEQQSIVNSDLDKKNTREGNFFARHLGQENQESILQQKQEATQIIGSKNKAIDLAQLSSQKGVMTKGALQENKGQSTRLTGDEIKTQDSVIASAGISSQAKEDIQLQPKVENKAELPIWAQLARDIHDKAFQARPHIRELDIQLHPAELGQVKLSLKWEDGQVHLRMTASESGTGQMLRSNLAELRDNLSQLGIQCGMLEMGLGDQQKNNRNQQGQDSSTHVRTTREESQEVQSLQELDILGGTGLHESKEINNRINVTA